MIIEIEPCIFGCTASAIFLKGRIAMKKIISLVLALSTLIGILPMNALAAEGAFTAQSTNGSDALGGYDRLEGLMEESHTHDYTPSVTLPTCTETGYTTYTCSCGDSYVADQIPALDEHVWGDWSEVNAPTCDAEGKDQRVCESCDLKQYRDTRITGDPGKILVSDPVSREDLAGKKILLIGVSITYGVNTTKTYGAYLAESLGVSIINKGVSGSGYCSGGAMQTN